MKWHDINKFELPVNTYLIFRLKHEDGYISIGCGERIYDGEKYFIQFDYDVCHSRQITHFCIPDAVEIYKGESA